MREPTKGTIHDPSWRAFAAWCRRLALCPLPAHPWTVGAFLRWCEERPGAVAIKEALVAIAAVHVRRGYKRPERHEIVKRTLAALARQRGHMAGPMPGPLSSGRLVLFRAKDFAASGAPRGAGARSTSVPKRSLRPTPKLVARRQYRAAS